MSKMLMILCALGLSLSSLASSECPALAGRYYCSGNTNSLLIIKEIEKDGVRFYKMNNEILKADGIEKKEAAISPADKPATTSRVTFCENGQLVSLMTQTENGSRNPYFRVTAKHYLDEFGDYTREDLIEFEGGDVPNTINCQKM